MLFEIFEVIDVELAIYLVLLKMFLFFDPSKRPFGDLFFIFSYYFF